MQEDREYGVLATVSAASAYALGLAGLVMLEVWRASGTGAATGAGSAFQPPSSFSEAVLGLSCWAAVLGVCFFSAFRGHTVRALGLLLVAAVVLMVAGAPREVLESLGTQPITPF